MSANVSQRHPGAEDQPQLVIITGMSGAGRSEAMHTFEDAGYFCIDNLPPTLIPQVMALAQLPGSRVRRMAVVSDIRGQQFFDELLGEIADISETDVIVRVLYLEADDAVLVRRFKESRRRHPLCEDGTPLAEAIAAERVLLEPVRGIADVVIDTSTLRTTELRRRIKEDLIGGATSGQTMVAVSSFGFKYGMPSDVDIVMDVRFLPNPFYIPALRELTGLDEPVHQFVFQRQETSDFLERWFALLDVVMPGYVAEGKTNVSIAMGCTGGMHRSVVLAEATADHLRAAGYRVSVTHRDIRRDTEEPR